jgi:uncharacterized protein YuzE
MTLEYDLDVGALYIRLTGERVARTRQLGGNANIDLDAAGKVIGIEVIAAAHRWPLTEILAEFELTPADVAQLRAYFSMPVATSADPRPTTPLPVVSAEPTVPVTALVAA